MVYEITYNRLAPDGDFEAEYIEGQSLFTNLIKNEVVIRNKEDRIVIDLSDVLEIAFRTPNGLQRVIVQDYNYEKALA